jgi:hypothetical protein
MAKLSIVKASTDVTVYVFIQDSSATTGAGLTGLVYNSSGLVASYVRPLAARAALSLATQTVTGAHSDGGFVEVDATNMPGWYRLDLSDAVCATGVDFVGVALKGATNMAPVNLEIQLTTFDLNASVTQTGDSYSIVNNGTYGNAQLTRSTTPANTLTIDASNQALSNITAISDDTTAAVNLESQYDETGLTGDTFPSRQDQLGNLSSGSSGYSINASGAVVTTGSETNSYTDTYSEGVIHIVSQVGGNTDFYYEYDLSTYSGTATEFIWTGYVQTIGDSVQVQYYDWATTTYYTLETISGSPGTTTSEISLDIPVGATGTGANFGMVRMRFLSTTTTNIGTDRVRCVFNQSIGGITNGSTITLDSAATNQNFVGSNWNLVLNGQDVTGAYVSGAVVEGVSSGSGGTTFEDCYFKGATLPPGTYVRCGFGRDSGVMTAASAGDYTFIKCFSNVPGSGTPSLIFSGLGSATGINNRGWNGGSNYTLDSDCTVSHEVHEGGVQAFTTGGADVELRGIFRSATYVLSGAGTVQQVGICGPITISGAATTTVNIYGVFGVITDTSSGTSVSSVEGLSLVNINTECDTALNDYGALKPTTASRTLDVTAGGAAGIDWANIENQSTTVDLSDTAISLVDTTTTNTDMRGTNGANTTVPDAAGTAAGLHSTTDGLISTVDGKVDDIPNNTEFNARTLPSDSYLVEGDTLARVTLVDTTTDVTNDVGITSTAVDNVWDELLTGVTHNIATSAGKRLRDLASAVIISGTSPNTGGTSNTPIRIELDSNASGIDGTYDPAIINIVAGTGAGQSRQIWEYDGPNRYAYVNRDFKTVPDNTSEYVVSSNSGDTHVNEGVVAGGTNNTITLNSLASSDDNAYVGQYCFLSAGIGADQSQRVTAYNGTTKVATVEGNWTTNPVNLQTIYAMLPVDAASRTGVDSILDDTGTSGVVLANDAITADKYDQSTAHPIASADSGSTQIAREANATTNTASIITQINGIKVAKNTAISNFPFFMVLASDEVTGATGLSVTAERSIDGGSFAAATNTGTISEIGNGWYSIDISAADMNGDTIAFKFAAETALTTGMTFITQS